MLFDEMNPITDDIHRRCSLPVLRTLSKESAAADMSEDRRLPPLPRHEPLPPGPFNPFATPSFVPSPPASQDSFPIKSSWPGQEHMMTPPSPANSAESSWQESFSSQKPTEWPNDLSPSEMMSLIAPRNINRKPPLQQLCGRKRKGSLISGGGDPDDQREKHRIAEGNRRKNLSQLHRELDSRIHDFFLERAGWNPAKSLPQSKEHIVQGAIFLIDFMLVVIVHLMRQEHELPRQLSEKLQPQIRCMQLQQLATTMQQQNQNAQQQMKALKQENEALAERNRALEFQLKSYEHLFRSSSPKSEATSPQTPSNVLENSQKNILPGLRVFCDEIGANLPEPSYPESAHITAPQYSNTSFLRTTPPMTGPPSPVFPPPSHSASISRRESLASSF